MNEETLTQLTASAATLAAAADALRDAVSRLDAQQSALDAKVDRIIAAIEEDDDHHRQSRIADLERANAELKAQSARAVRKTLSPVATALLAKNGADAVELDAAALEKVLATLSLEQRIAVKAEMARAGLIE